MVRRSLFLLVLATACSKPAPPRVEPEAATPPLRSAMLGPPAASIDEPMDTPLAGIEPGPPLDPDAIAPAAQRDAAPRPSPVAPAGYTYSDAQDLALNAGDARCPEKTSTETASVRFDMIVSPGKTVDLVIPSLNVRKRLWNPIPGPSSCYTSRVANGDALEFRCVTDEGSRAGKVYGRGSDVVLGTNSMAGPTVERFKLPCGTKPRFEAIQCPCPTNDGKCSCYDGYAPPASTSKPR